MLRVAISAALSTLCLCLVAFIALIIWQDAEREYFWFHLMTVALSMAAVTPWIASMWRDE